MGTLTHRRQRPLQPSMLENAAGNEFISTPDSSAWAVVNESAMVHELALEMADWTPSTDRILAQHGTTDGNLGWEIALLTTGDIRLSYFPAGTLASRVSTLHTPPIPLTNNNRHGLRCSFLSNFLGIASAYTVDWQYGLRWIYSGQIPTAALTSPFDSTEAIFIAPGIGIQNLYTYKYWGGKFGVGQIGIFGSRPTVDASINAQQKGVTSWTSKTGEVWTIAGSTVQRSNIQLPYAA